MLDTLTVEVVKATSKREGNTVREFYSNLPRPVWGDRSHRVHARSLGFLRVDAKAPGRWVLRVESPELVKQINSVFCHGRAHGGKQPSGQKNALRLHRRGQSPIEARNAPLSSHTLSLKGEENTSHEGFSDGEQQVCGH
jgi:hypothetical protein